MSGSSQEEVVYLLDRTSHSLSSLSVLSTNARNTAVMGDIGKGLYVAEDVVPIYRSLLSQATIITPNQFETEYVRQDVHGRSRSPCSD
jgi:hydroxymethylpyrimidine/phosphomethylpyrimidine kinase